MLSSESDETGPEIDRTKTINKNDPTKTGGTGQERDQKDCEKEGETDPETGGIGPEIGSPLEVSRKTSENAMGREGVISDAAGVATREGEVRHDMLFNNNNITTTASGTCVRYVT